MGDDDDELRVRAHELGERAELGEHGLPVLDPVVAGWTADRGYLVGLDLAQRVKAGSGPTAVFAANDQLALGLLRAFWECGVSVPDDVSVVGFDDVDGSGHFIPPLTTVRQPFVDLGRRSVALLLAAVDGGKPAAELTDRPAAELAEMIEEMTERMRAAAAELQFEVAARLRDEVSELKKELRQMREAGVR